jgi:hypothetical protein
MEALTVARYLASGATRRLTNRAALLELCTGNSEIAILDVPRGNFRSGSHL